MVKTKIAIAVTLLVGALGLHGTFVRPAYALDCETPVSGSLTGPDQFNDHTFNAADGEVVSIAIRTTGGDDFGATYALFYRDPKIPVDDPDDNLVALSLFGTGRRSFILTQSPTGSYVVRVSGNDASGSYVLDLVRLTPSRACGPVITCGHAQSVTLDTAGDWRTVTFDGRVGDIVSIIARAVGGAEDSPISHNVYDPNGRAVDFFRSGRRGWRIEKAGTYSIVVQSGMAATVEVEMQSVHPDFACAEAICPGRVVKGRIERAGDMRVFSFHGMTDELVSIYSFGDRIDSPLTPIHQLIQPDGSHFLFGQIGRANRTLGQTGTHLITIHPNSNFEPGPFGLTVDRLDGGNECTAERSIIYDPMFPRALGLSGADGSLPIDALAFEREGESRTGVIADGVTKLIFKYRVDSPEVVRFELSSKEGAVRAPGEPDFSFRATSVPRIGLDGEYYAFAIYEAPEISESVLGNGLPFESISVSVDRDSGLFESIVLELQRPPVLLVHGLWDSEAGWDWFAPRLSDLGFDVFRVSYPNFSSFHPEIPIPVNLPVSAVADRIVNHVLPSMRDAGIAATQVDVISHSLGGLVTRAYSQQPDGVYRRLDNYFKGDINSHVSIGSPHLGSELANLTFSSPCLTALAPLLGLATNDGDPSAFIPGAVYDMQVDGDAMRALNERDELVVPVHTIVGIASEFDEARMAVALRLIFKALSKSRECEVILDRLEPLTDPRVLYGGSNDLAVSIDSQAVGRSLGASSVSVFEPTVHSSLLALATPFPHERMSEEILAEAARRLATGVGFSPLRF